MAYRPNPKSLAVRSVRTCASIASVSFRQLKPLISLCSLIVSSERKSWTAHQSVTKAIDHPVPHLCIIWRPRLPGDSRWVPGPGQRRPAFMPVTGGPSRVLAMVRWCAVGPRRRALEGLLEDAYFMTDTMW